MLYICPTPIGNLGDITYRVIDTLKSVDLIACEDKRMSIKLLNHYDIKKPLYSYHDHNEHHGSAYLVEQLNLGKDVALISDAGTPGISDPGEVLIKACIEKHIPYTVLPGPSAMVCAVVASALPTQPFHYEGFLDRDKRKKRLEALKNLESSMVFYESPHRLIKTLEDLLSIFGDRKISVMRELTKRYESYYHMMLSDAVAFFSKEENSPRGEFVLVVEGYVKVSEHVSYEEVLLKVKERIEQGERLKEVVKELSKEHGIDRQLLYKEASSEKD